MKKTVLIYPYTQEYDTFIEQLEKIQEIETLNLVSFKGWGYENQKLSFHNKTINICTDFESKCQMSDEIWFVDSKFNINDNTLIYPKVKFAHTCGKAIRYYRKFSQTVNDILNISNRYDSIEVPDTIKTINTPIILTAGLYDCWNEMYVEIALNESVRPQKYNVIQIGSKYHGEVLGMYKFPQFMFDNTYTNREKILLFNQYVKQLEISKKPDLIIIGIPEGISSYSREIVGDFGMLFNLVSIAISVDIFILSIPYEDYAINDIYNICKYIWERYKIYTDFINIVPKRININVATSLHELRYLTLDNDLVMGKIDQLNNKNIYCLTIKSERDRLWKELHKRLSDFGEINII